MIQYFSLHAKIADISSTIIPIEVKADENISAPFCIEIKFKLRDQNIAAAEMIGLPMMIQLEYQNHPKITRHGFIDQGRKYTDLQLGLIYQVTVRPWFYFLKNAVDCEVYQQQTIPEIITSVFKKYREYDFRWQLTRQYPVQAYCIRYNESAFDFVTRLLLTAEINYIFLHENNRHILLFYDQNNFAAKKILNQQIITWKKYQTLQPTLISQFQQIMAYRQQPKQPPMLNQCRNEQLEITTTDITLSLRMILEIPWQPLQGNYQIQQIKWHVTTEKNNFLADNLYSNVSYCSPLNHKPKKQTIQKSNCIGVQIAHVIATDKITVNELGHIKIKFIWDRKNLFSCWAPLRQGLYPGQFIPRAGQAVLVGFLHGDAAQPVVLGSLPDITHPLPYPAAYHSGYRGARSANSNQLHFNDTQDQSGIICRAAKEMKVTVNRNYNVTANQQTFMQSQHYYAAVHNKLTIHAAQELCLQVGNSKITINETGVKIVTPKIQFGG